MPSGSGNFPLTGSRGPIALDIAGLPILLALGMGLVRTNPGQLTLWRLDVVEQSPLRTGRVQALVPGPSFDDAGMRCSVMGRPARRGAIAQDYGAREANGRTCGRAASWNTPSHGRPVHRVHQSVTDRPGLEALRSSDSHVLHWTQGMTFGPGDISSGSGFRRRWSWSPSPAGPGGSRLRPHPVRYGRRQRCLRAGRRRQRRWSYCPNRPSRPSTRRAPASRDAER